MNDVVWRAWRNITGWGRQRYWGIHKRDTWFSYNIGICQANN